MRAVKFFLLCCKSLIVSTSFLSIGCAPKKPPTLQTPPSLPFEEIYLHTVKYSGENLPMLSEWYTGKYTEWKKIRTYNGHIRSFILPKNSVIRIPKSLMIKTDLMSEEFFKAKKKSYTTISKTNSNSSQKLRPQQTPLPQIASSPEPELIPDQVEITEQEQDSQRIEDEDYPLHDELIRNLLSEEQK